MCKCIELTNKALEKHNLQLDVLMFLDSTGRTRIPVHTLLKEPKRGQKPMSISANYCPLCGEKYPEKDETK